MKFIKILGFFSLALILIVFGLSLVLFRYLSLISTDFSRIIGKPIISILPKIHSSITNNSFKEKTSFNFILLGLDPRNDSIEKTETTDTIIFGSFNFTKNRINLVSLPRDLWSYKKSIKINSFYPQAIKKTDWASETKSDFQAITGQHIDKIIVIETSDLIKLTDIIGGVDVYLEKGFTDNQYPNPEYIKNPSSSIPVYKTVTFSSGNIHLDSSNVTEFVRSRKSAETAVDGGTDIGRIQRQQLLIDAIIAKIKSSSFLSDYRNVFKLMNFWESDIQGDLLTQDIFDLGFHLKRGLIQLSFNKSSLPVGTDKKDGVIYHPDKFINKQWVFIPNTTDYKSVHDYIKNTISL